MKTMPLAAHPLPGVYCIIPSCPVGSQTKKDAVEAASFFKRRLSMGLIRVHEHLYYTDILCPFGSKLSLSAAKNLRLALKKSDLHP